MKPFVLSTKNVTIQTHQRHVKEHVKLLRGKILKCHEVMSKPEFATVQGIRLTGIILRAAKLYTRLHQYERILPAIWQERFKTDFTLTKHLPEMTRQMNDIVRLASSRGFSFVIDQETCEVIEESIAGSESVNYSVLDMPISDDEDIPSGIEQGDPGTEQEKERRDRLIAEEAEKDFIYQQRLVEIQQLQQRADEEIRQKRIEAEQEIRIKKEQDALERKRRRDQEERDRRARIETHTGSQGRENFNVFHASNLKIIPQFSGDILDYKAFFEIFNDIVGKSSLTWAVKLHLLREKLDPVSKSYIQHYPQEEYLKAIDSLNGFYTNRTHVITHVKNLVQKMPELTNTTQVNLFASLIEKLRGVHTLLISLNLDNSVEIEIFKMFKVKFPKYVNRSYMKGINQENPNLRRYIAHLEEELQLARNEQMFTDKLYVTNTNRPYTKRQVNNVETTSSTTTTTENPQEKAGTSKTTSSGRQNQKKTKFSTKTPFFGKRFQEVNQVSGDPQKNHLPNLTFMPNLTIEERYKEAQKQKLCLNCLKPNHFTRDCRNNKTCWHCGRKHNSQLCFRQAKPSHQNSPQVNNIIQKNETEDNDSDEDCTGWLEQLAGSSNQNQVMNIWNEEDEDEIIPPVFIQHELEEVIHYGLLDTGANVNLCPKEVAERLKIKHLTCIKRLKIPNGEFIANEYVIINLTIGKQTHATKFYIYPRNNHIILGLKIFKMFKLNMDYKGDVYQFNQGKMKLIRQLQNSPMIEGLNLTTLKEEKDQLTEIITKFKDIFAENSSVVGKITTEKFCLHLKHEIPINLRPYKCSVEDQTNIDEIIADLLKKEIIQTSTSPYSFPVVMVKKKDDGDKSRMCINYIKLNEISTTESYPMPRIEDIQDLLLDADVFSVLDLASGFWHIEVRPEDRYKTAFSTNHGHYEWLRMPFGTKNAPIVFQRIIANLLMKHKQYYEGSETKIYCLRQLPIPCQSPIPKVSTREQHPNHVHRH